MWVNRKKKKDMRNLNFFRDGEANERKVGEYIYRVNNLTYWQGCCNVGKRISRMLAMKDGFLAAALQ